MFSRSPLALILSAQFFVSYSAHAIGRCVVTRLDSIDANRAKEILIFADRLDLPAGRKEIWYVSNDGTVKVQIKRNASSAANSEVQANVLVNDATVLRAGGRGNGNFVGMSTSVALADGRALSLTCIAQPIP